MTEHAHHHDFCVDCFIAEVDPLLPVQGPIKDFIAGTRVPLFISLPFEQSLKRAESLYHSRSYMDLDYYRGKFSDTEISVKTLEEAILYFFHEISDTNFQLVNHACLNFIHVFDEKAFYRVIALKKFSPDYAKLLLNKFSVNKDSDRNSSRSFIQERINASLDHDVNAIFFRLLGSYLDQGVTLWPYLDRYQGFQNTVLNLAAKSKLPLAPFVNNRDFVSDLNLSSDIAIRTLLKKILADSCSYKDYLIQSIFNHPGWSGMVNMIEKSPQCLAKKRPIGIKEFLAVKLAIEWQFIKNKCPNYVPVKHEEINAAKSNSLHHPTQDDLSRALWLLAVPSNIVNYDIASTINTRLLQQIWHHALENSYYKEAASIILDAKKSIDPIKETLFQAIFCIDDRECSLRRHLEAESRDIETFGYAGFFGIDCYVKAHKKDLLDKMCPQPVNPQHIVFEKSSKKENNKGIIEFASFITLHGANSTLFGFISAYTIGHLSLFRLILSFLHPLKLFKTKKLSQQEKTTLLFQRNSDDQKFNDLYMGYSIQEMTDRVYSVLNNMGLKKNFAPLIFICGHGSSSVNNPHFAAYDCGACSGRPGAINARIFASMANMPAVRLLVGQKGINIPSSTYFVGGYHDTATDDVLFFDIDNLSNEHKKLLDNFTHYMNHARAKNAQERCRKFALVTPNIDPQEALREVHHRARALFEPRPELGHATNALAIVGRRSRSYLKNLDRRAFLQSYDPSTDEEGVILSNLLSAVIPVCGGINLEYMFSRIDPAVHGCGTKLSHNVCSLIGVGNGLDDDLRTGLPIQTTEIHVPIRLMLVIEQSDEIILRVIRNNSALKPWLENGWIKVASLAPKENSISLYDHNKSQFFPLH